jgi:hypothetical protein
MKSGGCVSSGCDWELLSSSSSSDVEADSVDSTGPADEAMGDSVLEGMR